MTEHTETSRSGRGRRRAPASALCAALAACALLSWSLAAPAAADPAGFAFLEVPTGARAAALGGAYTTFASGPEAAFWNPAGFSGVTGLAVAGGHAELFEKLRHSYFSIAGPMLGGGVGASIRALYTEPIDERDELGNLIGTFGSHDLEFGIGYGRAVGAGLAVGMSSQIVRERIADEAATTYSFGVGASWTPGWAHGTTFAASGSSIGPAAHYGFDGIEGEPVPLPMAFQAGVSSGMDVGSGVSLRGALEGRFTKGRSGVGMVGAELTHITGASLLVGARMNDETSSFGLGAGYRVGAMDLDYAFVPMKLDLGDSHRFAFRASF